MRKKFVVFILISILLLLFVSCEIDYHRGKRPIDYPNSYWECIGENYKISFKVGCPEECIIVIVEDQSILFEFLWSSIDSRVSAYEYGHSGDFEYYLFGGECVFGEKTFSINVNAIGEKYNINFNVLVFEKIE